MYELTSKMEFEAAHRIVGYPGKCNRLHGHNWVVEVTVAGGTLNELGMLVDFKVLKEETGAVIARLDHYFLNELEGFQAVNPTAENIARYIYEAMEKRPLFGGDLQLRRVTVWESPKSAVAYSKEG